MQAFLIVMLSAFGRAGVGAGWISRGLVYPVTACAAAWAGFGLHWWALPWALVPALTLAAGYTKWERPLFMAARFGVPCAILAAVYAAMTGVWVGPVMWVMACAWVGVAYSTLQYDFRPLAFRLGRVAIDSSRYAEAVAGAIIGGGPALVGDGPGLGAGPIFAHTWAFLARALSGG